VYRSTASAGIVFFGFIAFLFLLASSSNRHRPDPGRQQSDETTTVFGNVLIEILEKRRSFVEHAFDETKIVGRPSPEGCVVGPESISPSIVQA
jgi:hypothetical protein